MNNTAYHFILEFAFISIGIMKINIVFSNINSDSPNCHAISQP